MKTIYLSGTKEAVLNDLKKLNPEITEQQLPELSGEGWVAHWIGQIMQTPPTIDEGGNITSPGTVTENYHANVWVFDNYPQTLVGEEYQQILPVFDTEIEAPQNPVNRLA